MTDEEKTTETEPQNDHDYIDRSAVSARWRFMARDSNDDPFLYTERPRLGRDSWYSDGPVAPANLFRSYRQGPRLWQHSLVEL